MWPGLQPSNDRQRATLEARFHLTDGDLTEAGECGLYRIGDTTRAKRRRARTRPGFVKTPSILTSGPSPWMARPATLWRGSVSTLPIGLGVGINLRGPVRCLHRNAYGANLRLRLSDQEQSTRISPRRLRWLGFISYDFVVENPTRLSPLDRPRESVRQPV